MLTTELMDTSKWIDPPNPSDTRCERFFIRDNETHEWFMGLSRESFALYVLGKKSLNKWNIEYEPLRDEVHHLIIGTKEHIFDGKVFKLTGMPMTLI